MTQHQALIAAHRVLTSSSYEVESVDTDVGTLATEWRDSGQRSNKVVVTTRRPDDVGDALAIDVEVASHSRARAVRGWTKGVPNPSESSRLLRRIAREASAVELQTALDVPRPAAPAPEPSPQEQLRQCTETRQCPPGHHCGAGLCVWECATDDECEGSSTCDRRGRCLPVPPPPPPPNCPESPSSDEGEE